MPSRGKEWWSAPAKGSLGWQEELWSLLPEATFMAQIKLIALQYGAEYRHISDSRKQRTVKGEKKLVGDHDARDIPDLLLIPMGRPMLWAELKRLYEVPTSSQREFIEKLRAAGQDVRLWRPCDWDEIHAALRPSHWE